MAFLLTVPRKLRRTSVERIANIVKKYGIDINKDYRDKAQVHKVDSEF